jgi:hypothetical protein
MSLAETMATGIIYNVELVDVSVGSIAAFSIKLDRGNHLVVNSSFAGGYGDVNVIPEGLVKGRTYALTFGSDVSTLQINAIKEGSSDFTLWKKAASASFELPILFYIPDDYDNVKLIFNSQYKKNVLFTIEDVTETLLSLSEQKIPIYELGTLYSAVFPQTGNGSTVRARTKPGYRIHLKEGDVIKLKNTGYRFFLEYVRINDISTNSETNWITTSYTIVEEGLYCIIIGPSPEAGSYTDSKTLASQIEIISKEENYIQKNELFSDSAIKSLQYNIHYDNRTFSFSKTGHYIKLDGTLDDSTAWWMSNVIRLYKEEAVEVFCSTTSFGVIIALTDLEQSFYTPVVSASDHQVQALHKYTATEDCYIILQYFRITGSPSIYTESHRVISIENRLAGVDRDIDDIEDDVEKINGRLSTDIVNHYDALPPSSTYRRKTIPVVVRNNEEIFVSIQTESTDVFYCYLIDGNDNNITNNFLWGQGSHSGTYKTQLYDGFIESTYLAVVCQKANDPKPYDVEVKCGLERDIEVLIQDVDILQQDVASLKGDKPKYVIDETERIKRKLLSMLNGNATIFTFNTDQHFEYPFLSGNAAYNPEYVMHGVNAIVDVAKEIPLDMIVMGGDVAGYDGRASSTIKGILQEVEHLNSPFMDLNVPEVSIPGNHDAYQNNGNITAQGMYNVHFKRSKWHHAIHHSGSDNCDCYYDDTDKKIRYIFVDTFTQNVRTESYVTFLNSALSSMDEGYKAIIFSHNPLTNEFNGVVKAISGNGQEDNAFANPTDLHTTINQYADDIIACICGHSHCDAYGINSSGILFIETTTAASHTIYHTEDGIPYQRTRNSVNETAYDFFVIDTTNQTIEAVRYGQGTNRKWKYKGTGQGLISYKNCVSGTMSIPSLTLTFTNSSDNTDVVNVTCDGNGFYEVYLTLGATYTITCSGYTLDVNSVEVSENKVVDITATSE